MRTTIVLLLIFLGSGPCIVMFFFFAVFGVFFLFALDFPGGINCVDFIYISHTFYLTGENYRDET